MKKVKADKIREELGVPVPLPDEGHTLTQAGVSQCRQERGKQSQIAITSRWKCIVALGSPVVPDVNASRLTSSAAVASSMASACESRTTGSSVRYCADGFGLVS